MSADKHRSLARRIAWLRYFSAIGANGSIECRRRVTGAKNYPHVTVDLLRLEHDGLVRRSRVKLGWFVGNGTATAFEATASGLAVLHEALFKYGKDFGPQSLVHATQSDRPNKHQRVLRSLLPWEREKTVRASRRGLSIAS